MIYPYGIDALIVKPVTKFNVIQRKGRVGRKFPGHFYAVYTEQVYEKLKPAPLPDIIRYDISNKLLSLFLQQNNCFNPSQLDMLDNPPVDNIVGAIEKNLVLGTIKSDYGKCYTLSPMGESYKLTLALSLEEWRILLAAYAQDLCITDLVTILALSEFRTRKIDIPNILKLSLPPYFFKEEDYLNTFTIVTGDDFITKYFIFKAFETVINKGPDKIMAFCEKYKIVFNDIMEVIGKRWVIMEDLIRVNLDPFYKKDEPLIKTDIKTYIPHVKKIKQCLYEGYRLNILHNDPSIRTFVTRFKIKVKVKLPNNTIGFPKYVLTNKLKIQSNFMSPTYSFELESNDICILDGYVDMDEDFLTPIKKLPYKSKVTHAAAIEVGETTQEILENYQNLLKINNSFKMPLESNESLVKRFIY